MSTGSIVFFSVNAGRRPTRAKGRRGTNESRARAHGGGGRRGEDCHRVGCRPAGERVPLAGPAAGARATVIDVQPSRLQYALEAAAEQGVDLVVIDTPPRSESAAVEAARVANLVVIPCRAQILDLETVPATQQLLALAGNPPAVARPIRISGRRESGIAACPALVEFDQLFIQMQILDHRTHLEVETLSKRYCQVEADGRF